MLRKSVFILISIGIIIFNTIILCSAAIVNWPGFLDNDTPFSPDHGAVCLQNPPDFRWQFVTGAEKYELQLCRDNSFTSNVIEKEVYVNFYNHDEILEHGTWYWRVRFYKGNDVSTWSYARRFRIDMSAKEFIVPPVQELRARVSSVHPRIWVNSDTINEFRELKNGKGKAVYLERYSSVWSKLYSALPPDPTTDVYNKTKAAANDMFNAAFIYLIDNHPTIGNRAKQLLLNLASWNPEGSTSFVNQDQANRFIACKSAIAYDWLYHIMTPEERATVANMIKARTEPIYYAYMADSTPTRRFPFDSHAWTNVGYNAIISIAMLGDENIGADAEIWFENIIPFYCNFYPAWGGDDGGWSEGTGYWQWSTSSAMEVADVFLTSLGLNLYQKSYFRNVRNWLIYTIPYGTPRGVFGDSNEYIDNNYIEIISLRLAEMQYDPVMQWRQSVTGQASTSLYKYFYGDTFIVPKKPSPTLPTAKWFRDIGWVAMHSDLIDPNRVSFYFKSSPYGSHSHSRADQNAFILNAWGSTLALDSGYYDSYNSNHHKNFTNETFAHNSITVDGKNGQAFNNRAAKGSIVGFSTHPDFDSASGDATSAYTANTGNTLTKALRHIIYVKPYSFVVIDNLQSSAAGGSSYHWWLHSETQPVIDGDNAGARITADGSKHLKARIHYPSVNYSLTDLFLDKNGNVINPTTTYKKQWHLNFSTIEKKNVNTIVATLNTYKNNTVEPDNIISEDKGDYIKLSFGNGTRVFVRKAHTGMVTADEYIFEGAALTVKGKSVLLTDGTEVKENGQTIIYSNRPVTVTYGGNQLSVMSNYDAVLSINVPDAAVLRGEDEQIIPRGGVVNDNMNLRGIHWDKNGDMVEINIHKGVYALTVEQSSINVDSIAITDLSGMELDELPKNDYLRVNIEVTNSYTERKAVTLAVALYNENKVLKDIAYKRTEIEPGVEILSLFSQELFIPEDDDSYIKVFVWEELHNLNILCKDIVFPSILTKEKTDLQVGTVCFTSSGNTITQLTPYAPVKASVLVTNSGSTDASIELVLEEYLNGVRQRVYKDQKAIGSGRMAMLSAGFTAGSSVSGVTIRTYVRKISGESLSTGIFPSNDATINSITVNGQLLEGFSNDTFEYSFGLEPDEDDIPVVNAVLNNNCAELVKTDPSDFPGKTVIRVTSADRTVSREFTINYVVDEIPPLNHDYKRPGISYLGPVVSPSDPSVVFNNRPAIANDLQDGSKLLTDRSYIITEIEPSIGIKGSQYLQNCLDYLYGAEKYSYVVNMWKSEVPHDWLSLKLYESAYIMLFIEAGRQPVFATEENGWYEIAPPDRGYFYKRYWIGTDGNPTWALGSRLFVKEYNVKPGEVKNIILQTPGKNGSYSISPYMFVIKYK